MSVEDGESARILLSSAELLRSDDEYRAPIESSEAPTLYIKVSSLNDSRISNIHRIAALNRGNTKIVLFDESTRKYSAMKSVALDPSEKVMARLGALFAEQNVILK